jgi:hypothetical protein
MFELVVVVVLAPALSAQMLKSNPSVVKVEFGESGKIFWIHMSGLDARH